MRRLRGVAVAAVITVLVASCSPSDLVGLLSGQPITGWVHPAPTEAPSTPEPTPSPIPSSSASPSSASSGLPLGWTDLEVRNEAIHWGMPAGWTQVDVAVVRDQMQSMLDGESLPATLKPLLKKFIKSIDDGYLRVVIQGGTPGGTATSQVSLFIGPRVSNLAAAEAAISAISPTLPGANAKGPVHVTLALGDGDRYETVQGDKVPKGYIPARYVEVVTLLPDGRCVWVGGSAPVAEAGWQDFMTQLADAIRIP